MKILKNLAAAFSLYSRIPMPRFELDDEDSSGVIAFLPLVGALVGGVLFVVIRFLSNKPVNVSFKALMAVIIPLVITGGFHVDGFMDTVDAIRSYRSREEKLEILKDPHSGAFAITGAAAAALLLIFSFGTIIHLEMTKDVPIVIFACGVFVISRGMAALTSLMMKKAKDDGMLVAETKDSGTGSAVFLLIVITAVVSFMAFLSALYTGVIALVFAVFTFIYRFVVNRNFGGVTGDTAGFYIVTSEVYAITALAVTAILTLG